MNRNMFLLSTILTLFPLSQIINLVPFYPLFYAIVAVNTSTLSCSLCTRHEDFKRKENLENVLARAV